MSPTEELGRAIADEQDALLANDDDLRIVRERVLASVEAGPSRPRWRRSAVVLAAAAAVLAAVALLVVGLAPKKLEFTVGAMRTAGSVDQWLAAGTKPLTVDFSDGTRVALAPSSRARITAVEPTGATVAVETGHAEFAVVHRKHTSWRVTLGPFAVHVTGTRFNVDWDPDAQVMVLKLVEGRVTVSGCVLGDGRPVVAGETVRASCKERRVEITSAPPASASAAAAANPPASSAIAEVTPEALPLEGAAAADSAAPPGSAAPAESAAPAGPAKSDWRKLVRTGRYRDAYAAADAEGFDALCSRGSAGDLLMLGDAARLSGKLAKAEHAYLTLRQRFGGGGTGAVAAFMLARIAFDQRGAPGQAARWLQTYLSEAPGGPLAREALGRLIEAERRSGNRAGAEQTARQYLARYPSGPHAELARRVLGE